MIRNVAFISKTSQEVGSDCDLSYIFWGGCPLQFSMPRYETKLNGLGKGTELLKTVQYIHMFYFHRTGLLGTNYENQYNVQPFLNAVISHSSAIKLYFSEQIHTYIHIFKSNSNTLLDIEKNIQVYQFLFYCKQGKL